MSAGETAIAPFGILTESGLTTALKTAELLLSTGFLPKSLTKPAQVLAVIQKGAELGVPPMRALTGIHIIEGKASLSAELMLERFKQRGGHCRWEANTDTVARVWLKAPNGDEHAQSFTWVDAERAGLAHKDVWKKNPGSMLRARAVSQGLRALGEAEGMYSDDELDEVVNGKLFVDVQSTSTPAAPVVEVEAMADQSDALALDKLRKALGWDKARFMKHLQDRAHADRVSAVSKKVATEMIEELTSLSKPPEREPGSDDDSNQRAQ